MKKRTIMIGLAGLLGLSIFGGAVNSISNNFVNVRADSATYSLATSVSDLIDGHKYLIVNNTSKVALSTTQSSNNRGQASIAIGTDGSVSDISQDVQIISFNKVQDSDLWTFDVGNGYLYAASSSKNYLKTQTAVDANAQWSISFSDSDYSATIKAQGSNARNLLKYNSQNGIFSCYASGQQPVWIYKETASKNLTKIEISGEPTKKQYLDGEEFDPTGLTVTATYDDNSTAGVTSDVAWTPSPLTAGDTTVKATYKDGEQTFTAEYSGITVSKQEIDILVISGELTKTQYFVGEEFSSEGLTVTGFDTLEKEIDLTNKVTWSLSRFDEETTYTEVTATYVNEDGSIVTDTLSNIKIEVKEKTLEGIIVDASKMKLVYSREDTELDTTGLIVEACYPFGTYEDVTDKVAISKPDFTKVGEQTITVSFEGEEETFTITVNKYPETSYTYVIPGKKDGYYKVEQEQTDWSGKYLIAYCPNDTTANVFNGIDASNGYEDALVSSNFIANNNSLVSVSIEKYETEYAIKINGGTNDGKYISGKEDDNKLIFDAEKILCSVKLTSADDITIISNGSYLRFNNASNQKRFRFFKSSSYKSQSPISLFKYESNKGSAIASEKLLGAAYASLEELQKCDPNGANSSYDWVFVTNSFANLDTSEKTILETAIANGKGNAIERFLEKYDYLVSCKGQTDFLNRKPAGQSNTNIVNPFSNNFNESSTIAAIIAASGVALAIAFVLIRKRKSI